MKQVFFAISMAVVVAFCAAVGLCVSVLNAPRAVAAVNEGIRIVLDAGHGGVDGGVVGRETGVKESDVNLAITYKLKSALENLGFTVILTRKTEAGLYATTAKGFKRQDMQKRKEIIEEASPSMVISVHQNFYPTRNTRGAQVFYNKKNAGGQRLALILQKQLNVLYSAQGVKKRNAASGQFFMLECFDCPSVIVECGFLSNRADEALLLDEGWQKQLAEKVADGVMDYFFEQTA